MQINYELHQRQFLKSMLILHVYFLLAVSWTLYIKSHYKMHISEYVCKTCLKELTINTGKLLKNIADSNIPKNFALIFLPYLKNKYFLEHLTMATSGNVTKYFVLLNI